MAEWKINRKSKAGCGGGICNVQEYYYMTGSVLHSYVARWWIATNNPLLFSVTADLPLLHILAV